MLLYYNIQKESQCDVSVMMIFSVASVRSPERWFNLVCFDVRRKDVNGLATATQHTQDNPRRA